MKRPHRFLPLLGFIFLQTGCSLLPHQRTVVPTPDPMMPQSAPVKKPWHLLPHFSLSLPFFHHRPPPPRAQGLQQVGIIRTISADGNFVIIELEPGVFIPPGRDLLVTAGAGEPARLRSAENQPPYFIADIKSGHPSPGQTVFQ